MNSNTLTQKITKQIKMTLSRKLQRNEIIAAAAGILFFAGWWLMIDLCCVYPKLMKDHRIYILAAILSTLSLIIINSVSKADLTDWGLFLAEARCTPQCAKFYLFLGFIMAFGGMIYASYILIQDFFLHDTKPIYGGFAIWFQNGFIFASNMTLRFGIRRTDYVF